MKSNTKHIYKKKLNKKNKTNKKYKRGGSCGCQQQKGGKIKGGNSNFFGPDSFAKFDTTTNTYTYPVNTHINDPLNPSQITSVRMQPNMVGGKSKKNKPKKTNKHKSKKMKGGDFLSSNLQSSVFTPQGASTQVNVLSGTNNPSLNSNMQTIQLFSRTSMPFI